jgi:hypothetical protein
MAAAVDVVNWTAMVLLSQRRRVRRLAVWAMPHRGAGPICRNRGEFPHFGRMDEFPGVPVCARCAAEVGLLAAAVSSADD